MKKYSFVVAIYNVEKYLKKCLDSLVNQSYHSDYEIVLIDDGSTDSSGEICDYYAELYPNVVVVHQNNKGLMQTRKTGIENSTGNYLIFVDSDDYVDVNLLSIIDKYIEKSNPDFLMYGYKSNRNGIIKPIYVSSDEYEVLSQKQFLERFVGTGLYSGVAGKVIKSSLLKKHIKEIYDYSINNGEDKFQTVCILKYTNRCMLIRECPYYYVIRNTSVSHNMKKEILFETLNVCFLVRNKIIDIIDKNDMDKDELLLKYDGNSLNIVLDNIFKYDRRKDINKNEKQAIIKKLYMENKLFFMNYRKSFYYLSLHNKVRGLFMVKERFVILLYLDQLLSYFVK